MKVSEMMAKLSTMHPEDEVHFAYPFKDYWRTTAAPVVTKITRAEVIPSSRHDGFRIAEDSDLYDEDGFLKKDPDIRSVVVIS